MEQFGIKRGMTFRDRLVQLTRVAFGENSDASAGS
jgi:hypothetical protein